MMFRSGPADDLSVPPNTLTTRWIFGLPDLDLLERWRTLYRDAPLRSAAQSPEFVLAAFEAARRTELRQPELVLLLAENGSGGLVALWPALREQRGGRRWLVPPGFGALEEYSGPLLNGASSGPVACESLLSAAKALADVVFFTLPAGHPGGEAARRSLPFVHAHDVRSPATRPHSTGDIDAWLATKSGSFRKGLRYDRKQLDKLGPVQLFHGRPGDPETDAIIDWMFDEKRDWAAARGIKGNWLFSERPKLLVRSLFRSGQVPGDVHIYALTVGGTPAAAALCFESGQALELFVFVINPAFKAHSPGNLLLKELAAIAFAQGKMFDFRITPESYKLRWADSEIVFRTYACATRLKGLLPVAQQELHTRKVALRKRVRRALDALRKRA